jgi:hypothetical protein
MQNTGYCLPNHCWRWDEFGYAICCHTSTHTIVSICWNPNTGGLMTYRFSPSLSRLLRYLHSNIWWTQLCYRGEGFPFWCADVFHTGGIEGQFRHWNELNDVFWSPQTEQDFFFHLHTVHLDFIKVSSFIHQLMHKRTVLKTILKFTLTFWHRSFTFKF